MQSYSIEVNPSKPDTRAISSPSLFSTWGFDPQLSLLEKRRLSLVKGIPMDDPSFPTVVKTAMVERVIPLRQDKRISRPMAEFLAALTSIRAVVTWDHVSDIRTCVGRTVITIDPKWAEWEAVQPQIEAAFKAAFHS